MRAIVLLCLLHAAFAGFSNPWNGPPLTTPEPNTGDACSMDQGSCGCCLIQQKVNMIKMYFNMTLAKLEKEYLQTKQSLCNIEASRTAFSVALFDDVTFQCYGPFTLNTNIIYKHVFLNLGDSYSVDTGIFTVPHSGVYTIAITIYSDAGSSGRLLAACASLQVNGQVVSQSREQNRDDQEDSATVVLVLQLMAGDKVAVNLPEGCFLCEYNSFFNTFSAFLLYATE
ncbi:caprin-2-like [Seriola lalandi dorsalis]|uniref:caprin-2-like n=1 Tax=Seriola lalandi dorsalis TaxID=1841481 RepID=UPI000C6FBDB4|nr:caprin-2-like [Seriola lalandi dorsalis]